MTITATFALQNVPINADTVRQAIASLLPSGGGVVQSGDLPVTQTGTPSMGVSVGVGRAWIEGTDVAHLSGQAYGKQGKYFVLNDAPYTVSIATSDPTNPRIDVIYVAVQDATYSGSNNGPVIAVAKGVATSGATYPANAPSLPTNALPIAYITVPANVTSILNSYITQLVTAITKHAEWTITGTSQASGLVHNVGTFTAVAASTTDPNFYTIISGSGIQPAQPGVYMVTFTQAWSGPVGTSRAFLQINSQTLGAGTQYSRNTFGNAEDTASTTATIWVPPGGALYLSIYQQTGGALTNTGYVTIQKVG